jgi:plastocyanin
MTTTSRRLLAAMLALGLVAVLGGISQATHVRDTAHSARVGGDWKWRGGSPGGHLYTSNGHAVRWRVPSGQNAWHDVHATDRGTDWNFSKARLNPGQSVKRVFPNEGNYHYRCARHSAIIGGRCKGMCGIVHVV